MKPYATTQSMPMTLVSALFLVIIAGVLLYVVQARQSTASITDLQAQINILETKMHTVQDVSSTDTTSPESSDVVTPVETPPPDTPPVMLISAPVRVI